MGITEIAIPYLNGQPFYPPLRRALNLLFNLGMSSILFEYNYGNFKWIPLTNTSALFDFFLRGYFITPLCIFFLVSLFTSLLSGLIFKFLVGKLILVLSEKINRLHFDLSNQNNVLPTDSTLEKKSGNLNLPESVIRLYKVLKRQFNTKAKKSIKKELEKSKDSLEKNIYCLFRGIYALSFYLAIVPNFSLGLYILVILLILISLLMFLIIYVVLDLFPRFMVVLDQLVLGNPETDS